MKNRGTFVKRVGKPENGNPISPNQLFVYGDNIDASLDSRYLGPIRLNQVKGKAVLILYRNDTHPVWLKNLN
ncbi:MAG: S26 family signal peptidase [Cellvibrio sp.]|nr:S26 family signal peptidase [Cellvibrio sp.]